MVRGLLSSSTFTSDASWLKDCCFDFILTSLSRDTRSKILNFVWQLDIWQLCTGVIEIEEHEGTIQRRHGPTELRLKRVESLLQVPFSETITRWIQT
jgi:hypothetical protein